jgi:hypothetical protein
MSGGLYVSGVVKSRDNMTSPRFSACAALLVLVSAVPARAQAPPQTPPPVPAPDAPPAAVPGVPRVSIEYGVRFGPSFTSLTSVEAFDPTKVGVADEPTMNFGGFFTIRLPGPVSIQPEVLFAAKGQRVRNKDAPPVNTPTGVQDPPATHVALLRYLEVPLLFRMAKQTNERTSLYLIGGPAFGFRRNAVVREVLDPGRRTDINDEVSSRNLLVIVGGGLQHKRWLVDARLTRGMRNVAVDPQPAEVKTNAFSVLMGVRL